MLWKVPAGAAAVAMLAAGLLFKMWQAERETRLDLEAKLAACNARAATIGRDVERDNEIDNRNLLDVPPGWLLQE